MLTEEQNKQLTEICHKRLGVHIPDLSFSEYMEFCKRLSRHSHLPIHVDEPEDNHDWMDLNA